VTSTIDRAQRLRQAVTELIAERGFHGASVAAVAARAGVATGTAYVHYESKDELVMAAYVEIKRDLGRAAVSDDDLAAPPADRFRRMWMGAYRHLEARPERARFLLQAEVSPYARIYLDKHHDGSDDLSAAAATFGDLLVDLPPEVIFDLGFGPAIRLAARSEPVDESTLELVAAACRRAVTAGL
jgi:TetR/AcrR family transcriptional repressor of multidrug resistance operon